MSDTNKVFSELMSNWSKVQEQALDLQSKMLRDAGAAFSEAGRASAHGPKAEDGTAPGAPFDEIWTRSQDAFKQWTDFVDAALSQGGDGEYGAEMLARLMDPSAWLNVGVNELNQTIENLAEGVQFANLWRTEREVLQASREWLSLRQHSLNYRYIIMSAWMRAFDRFSEKVHAEMTEDVGAAVNGQEMMNTWLEIANDELLKTQRSDEFLAAQRDLLRASIDFRAYQQRFVEEFCEAHAIPTRSEVDDLHKVVTELRRTVRKLKAELAEQRAAGAAPASGEGSRATPKSGPSPRQGQSKKKPRRAADTPGASPKKGH